jgi:predicted transcriptional regulator
MNKMSKSEVYSWRLSSELKRRLEEVASAEKASIGAILERVMRDWLRTREPSEEEDAEQQRRLHERARKAIGTVSIGLGPYTNERVREVMGQNLEKKYRASQRRAPRRSR